MPLKTTPRIWSALGGSVDDNAAEVDAGNSSVVQNLYKRRFRLYARGGQQIISDLGSTTNLDGLFWARIGTTPYLLSAYKGDLYDMFNPSSVLSGGLNRTNSGGDVNFAWLAGKVYLSNGIDAVARWDGTTVARALPAAPPSGATLQITSAPGNQLTGTYTYRFAFVSYDGNYSYPSPETSGIVVTSQVIYLQNLPQPPAGQDITGIAIFRSNAQNSADVWFVAQVASGTTTYTDQLDDTTLQTNFLLNTGNLAFNDPFPPCQYLIEHQNRLVGANSSADAGEPTLYISNTRQPWYSPQLPDLTDSAQGTRIPLQDVAQAGIVGLCSHASMVAVFTGGAGYFLQGFDNQSWVLAKFTEHGATAHRAIVSTRSALYWLSWDGVYSFDGTVVQRVSNDMYNTLIAESAANLAQASAYVWDGKIFWCLPDRTLYLDLDTNGWGTLTGTYWRTTTTSKFTATQKPLVYTAEMGRSRVWQAEVGTTDNGQPIPIEWRSGATPLGQEYGVRAGGWTISSLIGHEKRVIYVGALFALGTGTVTISLFREAGELIESWDWDTSQVQSYVIPRSGYAAGSVVSRFKERCSELARAEFFEVEISGNVTAPFQLLDCELHYLLVR